MVDAYFTVAAMAIGLLATSVTAPPARAPSARPAPTAARPGMAGMPVRVAQIRVQQYVVIRVPRPGRAINASVPALPPINWVERRGERCVPLNRLAGAAITRADSVDLVLTGGRRLRARLGNRCPSLDFYSGFYLRPTADGLICADRDAIRSRSGGECRIDRFRTLVPQG